MLTPQDLQLLEEKFVTKKYFHDELSKFSDKIIDMISSVGDAIMSEISEIKKDIKEHGHIIDNHERRIEKLEESAVLSR